MHFSDISHFLAVCGVIVAAVMPSHPARADRFRAVEASSNGRVSVRARPVAGHTQEVLIIRDGPRAYRIPDERVSCVWPDGVRGYFNDDQQGTYPHNFYIAPGGTWLFVTRPCVNAVAVGYLIHCSARGGAVAVRPGGQRFDEAALRFYGRLCHFAVPSLTGGRRVIHFERWADHGREMVFSLESAGDYGSPRRHLVVGSYGLTSRRFRLIRATRTI